MLVNGVTLRQCIAQGDIEVYRGHPEERISFADLTIGPNSVDVTLGDEVLVANIVAVLDPRVPGSVNYTPCVRYGPAFLIQPHKVYLGYAAERFVVKGDLPIQLADPQQVDEDVWSASVAHLPVVQMLDGRSTVGRMGIMVHVTAGFGDVGFSGNFTLEIVNLNDKPVLLYPGMRIGQIAFHCVSRTAGTPMVYDGAYKVDHIGRPVPPVLGPNRF